jgi:hypothetical protein
MRFFLAACLWLACLAGECAWMGPDFSAATPLAYALTHTLALGVLGNVMLGALFQILSVLSGLSPRHPDRWLHAIFWPFQAGTAALVYGFFSGFSPGLLFSGAVLLAVSLLGFALTFTLAAMHGPARDPSTRGIRLALIGLGIAVSLGFSLSGIVTRGWDLPLMSLLPRHILWASNGWILMLLLSVALTVVPMFQLTAAYPVVIKKGLPILLLCCVTLDLRYAAAACAACFFVTTFILQFHSPRRHDVGRRFWMGAMLCGLAALALWMAAERSGDDRLWLATGWMWLGGMAFGAILGMLYKIVPFLIWLHLKTLNPPRGALPGMQAFIPEHAPRLTLWLHRLWICAGLGACFMPGPGRWPLAIASVLLAGTVLLHVLAALRRQARLEQSWGTTIQSAG